MAKVLLPRYPVAMDINLITVSAPADQMPLRVPKRLYEQIKEIAQANGISANSLAVSIIADALGYKHDQPTATISLRLPKGKR
jgi:hypothetical protein